MFGMRLLLVTAAMAAATIAFGWWGIPVVGAIYGVLAREQRSSALLSGIAGLLSWGVLLLWVSTQGPVGTLAGTLGGVLSIKPVGVYALTLCFPGLLALTSAMVSRASSRALFPAIQ
jgi:hypothetical protein